ncbi:MAG: ABC transporter substrate-binding protein [Gaiellaceae bacterium]
MAEDPRLTRGGFIKAGAAGAAGLSLLGRAAAFPADALAKNPPPHSGGTLRLTVAGGHVTDGTDPQKAASGFEIPMTLMAYETLVRADENFKLHPGLATAWDVSSDLKTWKFKLRNGVHFHNGKALTSGDVAYSFKRLLTPSTASPAYASLSPYLSASGISTPDPQTVVLALSKGNAFLPVLLATRNFVVLPEGATSFLPSVGTGPFKLNAFQVLASATLSRNENYWQNGKPYLDGIQLTNLADDATRLQSLLSGSTDMVDNITGQSIPILFGVGNAKPLYIKAGGWVAVAPQGQVKPFTDIRIRQAMKYAQNREQILQVVAPKSGLVNADIPVPTSDPYYPEGLKPWPYDPEKSKFLLKKAGYHRLRLAVNAYQGDKLEVALGYKSTAKAAGIDVDVVVWPHDIFFSQVWQKKPVSAISFGRVHVSQFLPAAFIKGGPYDESQWNNAKFTRLVYAAGGTKNIAKQKEYYGEALRMLQNSDTTCAPGFEPQMYGTAKRVYGVSLANGAQYYFDSAYLA